MAKTRDNPLPCVIEDCLKPANVPGTSKDMCSGHYQRKRRYGNPTEPSHRRQKSTCAARGCDKPCVGRGWCGAHWYHWNRYGDGTRRKYGEVVDGKRVCSRCRIDKPLEEFGRNKAIKSGYATYCKPCIRAKVAEWRTANPDYVQPKSPPAKVRAWARRWRQNNPDGSRRHSLQYYARKKAAHVESVSPKDVFDRDQWICTICHDPIDPTVRAPDLMCASVDHTVPLSRGGQHSMENVQAAHLLCNLRKTNKLMAEIDG